MLLRVLISAGDMKLVSRATTPILWARARLDIKVLNVNLVKKASVDHHSLFVKNAIITVMYSLKL